MIINCLGKSKQNSIERFSEVNIKLIHEGFSVSIFNVCLQEGYINTCSNENDLISAQKYILDYLMLIAAAGTKVFMTVKLASEILKTAANG